MSDDIYELHASESGRWNLVERFRAAEKDEAIAQANRLFASPSCEAVRVVRETFDETEQVFKQRTIFRNAKPKSEVKPAPPPKPKPRPAAPVRGAMSRTDIKAAPLPKAIPAPEPVEDPGKPMDRLVKRVVLATTAGLTVAGGTSLFFWTQATDEAAGALLGANNLVFSASMFLAAFVLSLYLYGRSQRAKARAAGEAGDTGLGGDSSLDDLSATAEQASEAPSGWSDKPMPAVAEAPAPAPAAPAAVVEEPPKPAPPPEEDPFALPAVSPGDRDTLLRFFRDCLVQESALPFVAGKMNGHNKFGLHLFLLGAGEACLAANGGKSSQLGSIMQTALEMLGTDAERARSFVSRQQDYVNDERYRAMIESGRRSMRGFLAAKGLDGSELAAALKAWNQGVAQEAKSDIIAIMFTDMVSSVQTTQALGDEGMMKLVQTHNLIVGAVLKTHRGHQVKHTGDGVMAVFPKVADGVAAAGEIQRQISEHNRVTASHNLAVRIGVACGQPIRDQDDYFGTVVQLAARLCAVAGEAEVCVADALCEVVGDQKRFVFTERREVPLKGFQELQWIRMLQWGESGGAGKSIEQTLAAVAAAS